MQNKLTNNVDQLQIKNIFSAHVANYSEFYQVPQKFQ